MNKINEHPLIIGGPGRSGKTLLVNLLSIEGINYYCLLQDVVLDKNLLKSNLENFKDEKKFLKNYFFEKRFSDRVKSNKSYIFKNSKISFKELILNFKNKTYPVKPIESILRSFNKLSLAHKKKSWVCLDVHPEFYFEKYKNIENNLKIVYMKRNPIEVVCSHLDLPKENIKKKYSIDFWYAIFFWMLSEKTFNRLSKKFPNDVYFLDINNLEELSSKVNSIFGTKEFEFPRLLNNQFDLKKNLFYINNKWRPFFSEREVQLISKCTNILCNTKYKLNIFDKLKVFLMIASVSISQFNPHLSRYLVTYIFFPTRFIYMIKERLKLFLPKKLIVLLKKFF